MRRSDRDTSSCPDVCRMQGAFVAAAGCYMSGHRSEVRGPTATPDGPFPFLEKIVSRNTSNPRHINRGVYAESRLCQETISVATAKVKRD